LAYFSQLCLGASKEDMGKKGIELQNCVLWRVILRKMKIGDMGKRRGFKFGAMEMWNDASSVVVVSTVYGRVSSVKEEKE